MKVKQLTAKQLIDCFNMRDYRLDEFEGILSDVWGVPYGDGLIKEMLDYLGTLTFASVCPSLAQVIGDIEGSAVTDLEDIFLLESFSSFHLSMKFIILLVSAMMANDGDNVFNAFAPLEASSKKSQATAMYRVLNDAEKHQGANIVAKWKAYSTSYSPDDALLNKDIVETITPEVVKTISTEESFKTTTSNKSNFKTEVTESDSTHGFDSSTEVPTTGSQVTTEGTDEYNNSEITMEGGKDDNFSTITESKEGSDEKTIRGFDPTRGMTRQDLLAKEMQIRSIDFLKMVKEAIRREMLDI